MKTINSLRSKLLVITLALMASVSSFAYDEMPDFQVDGLYYNFLEGDNVEVTHPYRPEMPTEGTSTTATQDLYDDYAELTELTIPSTISYEGKVYNVIRIGYAAFDQCNLTYVDIPSSIKTIGVGAFSNCSSLTSITLKEGLEHIEGNAFADCRLLETITFPNSLKTVGSYAFSFTAWYNNQPNGGVYAGNVFYKYKGDIPENTSFVIKEGTVSISPDAFIKENRRIDYGLVAVAIPNSVEIIGEYAFSQCRALRSVNIPSRVTTIESYAFSYCKSLTSVTSEIVEPLSLPSDVFFKASVANATLYVPAESVEAYKNADQWKDFGQILPIEPTSYKSQWCDKWNMLVRTGSVHPPVEATYRYQLAQDTVIGDYTYTAVVSKAINDALDAPRYVAAVRFTDDRKVYIYYDNAEYLLYDFNVQQGDELEVFAGINNYRFGIKTYKCIVTGVEQYACIGCPATITLHVPNHPDDFTEIYRRTQWQEGVGDVYSGFLNGVNGYVPVDGGGSVHLLCAYQGDELKYTGDLYEEYGCGDDAEQNPEDLFPTLWGLQRTSFTEYSECSDSFASLFQSKGETITINHNQYLKFGGHYLREENKQVLLYSRLQDKDLVLYDYSLEVGDTLTTLNIDYRIEGIPFDLCYVDYAYEDVGMSHSIDTLIVTDVSMITLLDGKEYKKWTFNNGMEYVEGIGSFGNGQWSGDFFQLIANKGVPTCLLDEHLVCASKNNKLLYQMDEAEMERLNTECLCESTAALTPEDLFPTLWGLQRTVCNEYCGETEDDNSANNTYKQTFDSIFFENDKPYILCNDYLLREEDNKILIYSQLLNKDLVLYDFTLEVGDSLPALYIDYHARNARNAMDWMPYNPDVVDYNIDFDGTIYPADTFVVTDVSNITLLDGKEYKKWTFNNGMEYVEGIGMYGGRRNGNFFGLIQDVVVPCHIGTHLVCVSKNNKLLYQMDDEEMERLGAECLCDYNSGPKRDNAKDGQIGGRPTPTQWNMLEMELRKMENGISILQAETFSYTLEDISQQVNSRTYFQLARQSTKDTATTKSVVGALHFGKEEDNRVYFLRDGVEYVLYDFTVEPGDTVEIFAGINNYPQETTYTHVVTSKDTLENGACRMMLEVVFPEETSTAENVEKVWLAGLGSVDGIVHNAAKRTSDVHAAPARSASSETQTSVMLCAWREDSCLYTTDHPDYDTFGCVYNQDPTSVENPTSPSSYQKLLRDGQLLIIHNDKIYNVLGLDIGKSSIKIVESLTNN